MDSPPAAGADEAAVAAAVAVTTRSRARRARKEPVDTLGKEVRESFLLLGLSLGITAGLTFALQAAASLVG